MYARCTKCNWKTWAEKKKDVPKACPKCKSEIKVTEG